MMKNTEMIARVPPHSSTRTIWAKLFHAPDMPLITRFVNGLPVDEFLSVSAIDIDKPHILGNVGTVQKPADPVGRQLKKKTRVRQQKKRSYNFEGTVWEQCETGIPIYDSIYGIISNGNLEIAANDGWYYLPNKPINATNWFGPYTTMQEAMMQAEDLASAQQVLVVNDTQDEEKFDTFGKKLGAAVFKYLSTYSQTSNNNVDK